MKELIRVRVKYASRHKCCKTHKRALPFYTFSHKENKIINLQKLDNYNFHVIERLAVQSTERSAEHKVKSFTFSEPCIVIHTREKDQQDAQVCILLIFLTYITHSYLYFFGIVCICEHTFVHSVAILLPHVCVIL